MATKRKPKPKPKPKPKLNQIEIFPKLGGRRDGSGRKKGSGSVVMRIPFECVDAVNAIIAIHRLKSVTEIKRIEYVCHLDTYINPNNQAEQWSGIGKKPAWIEELIEQKIDIETYRNPAPSIKSVKWIDMNRTATPKG